MALAHHQRIGAQLLGHGPHGVDPLVVGRQEPQQHRGVQVGGVVVLLAHGISTAFQLAAVFAALTLAVTLVVVRARTLQEVPVESS